MRYYLDCEFNGYRGRLLGAAGRPISAAAAGQAAAVLTAPAASGNFEEHQK